MSSTNKKLFGKLAIITGGSSGIGLEAAKDLASRGAKVIIASRNETKLKSARENIQKITGNQDVSYKILDLGSLRSVRNFAHEVIKEDRLDVLINNAGAVGLPDRLTADELNLTMHVNFFGTFLLTYLLLPLLKTSAPSKILNGCAVSMFFGEIDFDRWNDVGRYSIISSLANSKLAMNLYTAELNRRLIGSGVTVNSFDPFVVRDTEILGNVDGVIRSLGHFFVNTVGQRKEDVGKQLGYLASAPELEGVSGVNYKFCRRWLNHWLVNDKALTKNLWNQAKKLVKIKPEEDWESN